MAPWSDLAARPPSRLFSGSVAPEGAPTWPVWPGVPGPPKPTVAGFGRESSLQLVMPPWELAGSGSAEQGSGLVLGGRNQPFPDGGVLRARPAATPDRRGTGRHGQQRGPGRAGNPNRPWVDQAASGAADQDQDDQVDRHRGQPDRPQHLERRRKIGDDTSRRGGLQDR